MKARFTPYILIGVLLMLGAAYLLFGDKHKLKIAELAGEKKILKELRAKDSIHIAELSSGFQVLLKQYDSLDAFKKQVVSERDVIQKKYDLEKNRVYNLNNLESAEYFAIKVNNSRPLTVIAIRPDTAFFVTAMAIKQANKIFISDEEKGFLIGSLQEEVFYFGQLNDNLTLQVKNKSEECLSIKGMLELADRNNQLTSRQLKEQVKITRRETAKGWIKTAGAVAAAVGLMWMLK